MPLNYCEENRHKTKDIQFPTKQSLTFFSSFTVRYWNGTRQCY